MENGDGLLWGQSFKVLLSGCDDHACHVKGSRTDDQLVGPLLIIAVRTVLATRKDHREKFVVVPPADDIHHRFCLVLTLWQCLVKTAEELLVTIERMTPDEQGRTRIFLDEGDVFILVETDDGGQVPAKSSPSRLQRQETTGASLEVGMVGS